MNILFFRNDDVRDKLDDSLIELNNIFIHKNIPIIYSVEPANVSQDVVDWLVSIKIRHPDLIEIIQHGYDHKVKNKLKKGEFGGQRTYEEQLKDIKKGKALMDKYFGNMWFEAFSFPYGVYNYDTLFILNDLAYKVISTGSSNSIKRQVLNTIGRLLNRKFLFNKSVTYFNEFVPKTRLLEIPILLNITKKQISIDEAIQKNTDELISSFKNIKKDIIGVLLHHRFLKKDDIKKLEEFLGILKKEKVKFSTMKNVCNEKMVNM